MSEKKAKVEKDWETVAEKAEASEEVADDKSPETIDAPVEEGVLEHPSYKKLQDQLTVAEAKGFENWEKFLRAQADLENIRQRAQRDVANAHKYALENFSVAILDVVDSLEQALIASETHAANEKSIQEGVELTLELLLNTLKRFDITQLNPVGEVFDPALHEAMSMQEDDEAKPNTVLAVIQKGYKLNERLIRPARVIVAKG